MDLDISSWLNLPTEPCARSWGQLPAASLNDAHAVPAGLELREAASCRDAAGQADSSGPARSALPANAGDARATVARALRLALALLDERPEHGWAREFVLDRSPQAAAHMFSNGAAVNHAVWADLAWRQVEPDGAHAGLFDAVSRYDAMFVPVFSTGNLTVGVYANRGPAQAECSGRAREDSSRDDAAKSSFAFNYGGRSTLSVGRYVHESATGRMLVVSHTTPSEQDTPSYTNLFYMHAKSTTRSERIRMLCDGALFALGKCLDSVLLCTTTHESRFCPLCGASPGSGCGCKFREHKSAHSFDFAHNFVAMSPYSGDYLGTSSAVAAIPSRATRLPQSDIPSSEKLYWSTSNLMANTRINGFCAKDPRHVRLAAMFQEVALQLSTLYISPLVYLPLRPAEREVPGVAGKSASRDATLLDEIVKVTAFGSHGSESAGLSRTGPSSAVSVSKSSSKRAVPPSLPSPICREEDVDGHVRDLAAREMARRLKNREASLRANARRREKNDALKKGLADALLKAEELRRTETKLRSENVALRRRLGPVHLKRKICFR